MLKAIRQGKNETLREYIERFNKEAVNVRDLTDKKILYFMEDGLQPGSLFHVDIGANQPVDLEHFLHRSQKFIDYEE